MVRLSYSEKLLSDIKKRFSKHEALLLYERMESVREQPRKGKAVGHAGGLVIKELKYKKYRIFFLGDGHKLRFCSEEELVDLLLRFVRIADKKEQQDVIEEIKDVLRSVGPGGL